VDFQVLVDPSLPPVVPDAISFETGTTPAQASDRDLYVYEHHSDGFTAEHQGALTRYFEDLALVRRMPPIFATRSVRDVDTIFAITLFLNRDLVLVPGLVGRIAQIELAHRRGIAMLGHLDPYMVGFIRLLRGLFPDGLAKRELGVRINTACSWVRDIVTEGAFPAVAQLPRVDVLERGSGGFVAAETAGDLVEGWVVLFADGYTRGVIVGPEQSGRRKVVAARKSAHVTFNISLAAKLLNDVETAMGEPPSWEVKADWLFGPSKGSLLTVPHMLEVFLRV